MPRHTPHPYATSVGVARMSARIDATAIHRKRRENNEPMATIGHHTRRTAEVNCSTGHEVPSHREPERRVPRQAGDLALERRRAPDGDRGTDHEMPGEPGEPCGGGPSVAVDR